MIRRATITFMHATHPTENRSLSHDTTGLTLLRASRLETLLAPLETLLAQTRPEHPLEPQTLIAAHPGMKQWLTGALARQVGTARIVANLDVVLPSTWLDRVSDELLGARAVALPRYRQAHLRWTLHAMLDEPARHGIVDSRVLAYLHDARGEDERALRRFQLADRLARVYSQYLVYRSDWLQAWEAGIASFATAGREDVALNALEAQCLAPLWKAVATQLGEHRARLVDALVTRLDSGRAQLPALHVFGLSHLPPVELSVLRAYARRAPVFLYLPDPCREFWGGLYRGKGGAGWRTPDVESWGAFRDAEAQRLADPDAIDWREQGHPLLARWGRLGQQFFAGLVEGELREDIRHWQDEQSPPPSNRLERLQESIRQLKPELMSEDAGAAKSAADASLRIHACHTRQRELEVLRDALLDAIEQDGVRAGEIVVMAPDIQSYLPLIPAVFGESGSTRERLLPHHLADVPVARSHPMFAVLQTLLGLGASRVSAPEVVDLLGVAEVRRALGLDEDAVDTLIQWLTQTRVAWALDGAHKASLSLPARAEFSFAWAMDRLMAGYLMADAPGTHDPDAVLLPDDTELLPMAGIEGPGAAALGSLDRLLCELQAWRDLAQHERPASEWAQVLRVRVDALIRIESGDRDARSAQSVIHRAIASIGTEPARNGEDPVLPMAVVRDLLLDALGNVPERQRFLMSGVTFCGMVPQRAIPFAVVCVLGLNEGAFPRRPVDGGIDLMARIRRVGDRDVVSDDRYLFLETVMSARKRLHLSCIGQGVRDGKPRNPAAPLAELMAELDLRAGIAPEDDKAMRPWLVRHPLQPFDVRYFDGSQPALYSYSQVFAGMSGDGTKPLPRLRDGATLQSEPLPDPIALPSLEAWFKDPARALLKEHLHVSLDALDDDARLPDNEPMDGIAHLHTVARRVFLQQVLPRTCADPGWQWDRRPPAWVKLGGVLPLGDAGRVAWENEAAAVEALSSQADARKRFDARSGGGGQAVHIDVSLDASASEERSEARRITGIVRNVFPLAGSEDGLHVVFAHPDSHNEKTRLKAADELGFKERVPAFLHWALLRLQGAASTTPVRLTVLADGEPEMATRINAWDRAWCDADRDARNARIADLQRRVLALIELWRRGLDGLSWFYPKVGWVAVNPDPGNPEPTPAEIAKKIRSKWASDDDHANGERDYSPGYARMLEGDLIFGDVETDPDQHALNALLADARQVERLILLEVPTAPGPVSTVPESTT